MKESAGSRLRRTVHTGEHKSCSPLKEEGTVVECEVISEITGLGERYTLIQTFLPEFAPNVSLAVRV